MLLADYADEITDTFTQPVTLKADLEEQIRACRLAFPRLGVKG
jgi:hypothetical protein